jgi:hypothetical protein
MDGVFGFPPQPCLQAEPKGLLPPLYKQPSAECVFGLLCHPGGVMPGLPFLFGCVYAELCLENGLHL